MTPEPDVAALRGILDSITDAVVVVDADDRIVYRNAGVAALVGAPAGDGTDLWTAHPVLAATELRTVIAAARRRGEPVRQAVAVDALYAWFHVQVFPDGEHCTVFLRDVTAQRRTRLRHTLQQLLTRAAAEHSSPVSTAVAFLEALRAESAIPHAEAWLMLPNRPPGLLCTSYDDEPVLAAFADATRRIDIPEGSRIHRALTAGVPLFIDDLASDPEARRGAEAAAAGLNAGAQIPFLLGDDALSLVLGFVHRGDAEADEWLAAIIDHTDEIHAVLERQHARHELAQVFELAEDLIAVIGPDGRFKRVNPAFTRLLGWTAEELTGRSLVDHIHPDDLEDTRRAFAEAVGGHPQEHFENRYRSRDGEYRTLAWSGAAVQDDGVIYAVARDVTAEARQLAHRTAVRDVLMEVAAGAELTPTLDRLMRLTESRLPGSTATVLEVDREVGRLRHLSAPSLPSGFAGAVDGSPLGSAVTPARAASEAGTVVTADITTDPAWEEHRDLAVRHGLRGCWAVPLTDRHGEVVAVFALYLDEARAPNDDEVRIGEATAAIAGIAVTRHLELAELADREERFRLMASATSDALWDWDFSTDTLWWSEGVERLFGYTTEEVSFDPSWWVDRVHPDDRGAVVASLQAARDGDAEAWQAEYRFRVADGGWARVEDRGTILRGDDGVALRAVGGVTDVTQRRELEEQYLRSQRMESLGALAGGIAHDLNNVLTPIMMSADLLAITDLDDQQRQTVATIAESAQRSAVMVDQILAFARGSRGERVVIAPDTLVNHVGGIVAESFPKAITVRSDVAAGTPSVFGDVAQLQQVLLNLLVNARDAMPNGGVVAVSAEPVEVDRPSAAMLGGLEPGGYVLFTVADTGVGMPADVRERAFEPFFTTKASGFGAGLGLSSSRTVIEAHDGAIHLYTERGRGTTVKVYLPVAEEPAGPRRSPDGRDGWAPRGSGEVVLVVDDEAAVRAVASQTLKAYGYGVVTARDGDEAVALYARQGEDIDVVVTDVTMPVFDGIATTQALRRIDPDARVIVASGLAGDDKADRAGNAGAREVLPKPYTTEQLLRAVRRALDDTA